MVKSLDHRELMKLKKDLRHGGIYLKNLVREMVKENEKKNNGHCVICGEKINQLDINNYTLLWGPEDFKKKASFCAIDCLKYFLTKLEDVRRERKYLEVNENGE